MSSTTPTTDAESSEDADFEIEKLTVDKDGEEYVHTRERFSRKQWFEGATSVNWATLASQECDGKDIEEDDDVELVAIQIFGWWVNEDEDWRRPRGGYGEVYGKATTLAVMETDEESESGLAESKSGKAYRFTAIQNADGKWQTPRNEYAPKTGVNVFRGVGVPSELDKQPIRPRDGYAETEEGRPDFDEGRSFERAMEQVRERIEAEQNPHHEYIEELVDDYGGVAGACALAGVKKGQNSLQRSYGRELDPEEKEALGLGVVETVTRLMDQADDLDELKAILGEGDD